MHSCSSNYTVNRNYIHFNPILLPNGEVLDESTLSDNTINVLIPQEKTERIDVYREWAQVAYSCVPNILIYSGQHSKIHAYNPKVVTNHGLIDQPIIIVTKTSESYVMRADLYAKGVNAAEEVLPGIKNDLLLGKYKPRETDVAAIAKAAPEERREKAEQLRVIPEKKPKADKESARSGTKRRQEVYATIDKSYEDMKDSKRVTEDSALVSLRYTARNMVETCDVLFTNFPGLLEKPDYKDQVIEIMQEPKQYILKLEGETDNEQH